MVSKYRIKCVDNFARETKSDKWASIEYDSIEKAKRDCEELNAYRAYDNYYKVVELPHELYTFKGY